MKKIYIASLIAGITLTLVGIMTVNANPSQFGILFTSDTGSTLTSPTYTLAGKATSTLSIKSQSGVSDKYEKAIVQFQITSTTTPPTLLFRVETSFDNSTWYSYSTTTGSTSNITPVQYSYVFSSTTNSTYSAPSGDVTKQDGSFTIDIPAPYTRVKAYSPIGNPAYNLYIVAKPVRESK